MPDVPKDDVARTGAGLGGGSGWVVHAYQMDFGAAAAKYIDTFFTNIRWDEVNHRYERALWAAKALRG